MNTARRPLAALLIESAAGHTGTPLTQIDFDARELMEAGRMHRVLPALRRRLRDVSEVDKWVPMLDTLRHQQLLRHMQAGHDLACIERAFEKTAVRWAVSKGPILSDAVWPHPDMREYTDVDVFVHPADFADALCALEQAGFSLIDRNWPEIRRLGRAEVAMVGPSGFPLDLHWDIAVTPRARSTFRFDLPSMLGRARPVRLGTGVTVPMFDATDLLLHVAFHAAQNGANRLVWIADALHCAQNPDVDWERLARDAAHARAATPVAMVIARVERTFDVLLPLPQALRNRACTSISDRTARFREAARPFPGLPNDRALSGLEFSSARDNPMRSLGAAIWQWIEVRIIERRVRRHGADANPLDSDVPDLGARHEYLSAVRATAASV